MSWREAFLHIIRPIALPRNEMKESVVCEWVYKVKIVNSFKNSQHYPFTLYIVHIQTQKILSTVTRNPSTPHSLLYIIRRMN